MTDAGVDSKQARGREWKRRTYVIMLVAMWIMFCFSTSLWVSTFALVVARIRSPSGSEGAVIQNAYEMTIALGRFNVCDLVLFIWNLPT